MDLIAGFKAGLRPILKIELSEWSCKYRRLSSVASSRPGRYDINNTPPLIEITDCLSERSEIQEVIFKKGSQIGATEIGNNWIGYTMHVAPSGILMIMSNDEMVKTNSTIRIEPMINDTPVLRERVGVSKSRDGSNNIKNKSFPDGILLMKGANSPASMRSIPTGKVMLDELSSYPSNIGGEGSGMKLAKARTRTFPNRKIYAPSTPTKEGVCAITLEYENSDKRIYEVPCPHCGNMDMIDWKNMQWDTDEETGEIMPHTIRLICVACKGEIYEKHKVDIIAAGKWRATNPNYPNKKRRGYHLSALYSTLGYTWEDALTDYKDGLKREEDMITWVNTVLGMEYKTAVDAPEWEHLYNRREQYKRNAPPSGTAFITAGVDVQRNRLEIEIKAWGKGKENWSLDYRVIMGDTQSDEPWIELDKIINETWVREDGAVLPLAMMCIDSSDNTSKVYEFCRKYDPTRVVAIKGRAELTSAVGIPKEVEYVVKDTSRVHKVTLFTIGVDILKSQLYGWFRQMKIEGRPTPIGYCHFPEYEEHYFKMITAERKEIVTTKQGFKKYQWVLPGGNRNEALDCNVYATAAAIMVGMDQWSDEDWDYVIGQYETKEEKDAPEKYNQKKGGNDGNNFLPDVGDSWL